MNTLYFLRNPRKIVAGLLLHFGRRVPDRLYLKLLYWACMGERLDLGNPRTFNEKLQWLKLYDRRDEYTTMVDKVEAKKWVAERIGEQYVIPTLGVWERPEDIDFDALPDKFVMKTNHDSGQVCICTDKSKLDREKVRREMAASLRRDYYLTGREWPYKNVRRRILAEQYLECGSSSDLVDYKFFCFGGEPRFIQVIQNRRTRETIDFFDLEWRHQEFVGLSVSSRAEQMPEAPETLAEMIAVARAVAVRNPFSRIDLYEVNGKVYFGEITFYPAGGFGRFQPEAYNEIIGEMISLPGINIVEDEIVVENTRGGGFRTVSRLVRDIPDYKFMCFNGKVGCCFTCTERRSESGVKVTFFDKDWQRLPFVRHYPAAEHPLSRPKHFDKMKELAERLAAGIAFLRVDFYELDGRIYFGELTFFPGGGMEEFSPEEWDFRLGEMIDLSSVGK